MNITELHFICRSENDTLALAEALGRQAWPGLVVGLSGSLGAGKTVFARGFAQGLDISDPITSPSYPIIQEYQGRLSLCHMDWYRLGSEDEVLETGAGEYLDSDSVCLIEWPSRAIELLAFNSLSVAIAVHPNGHRRIVLASRDPETYDHLDWPAQLPLPLANLLEDATL